VDGAEAHGVRVRDKAATAGNVRFVNCVLRDAVRDRPPIALESQNEVENVSRAITVRNPHGPRKIPQIGVKLQYESRC
jgi:hypothetical protein